MDSIIIGIAGGTGSGKSTFTKRLKKEFGDRVCVVYYDNYYKAHDDMTFEERALINYDHPDSFETDLLLQHLERLRKGYPIECPIYDYSIHNRTDKTKRIDPADVIIVEGILVLHDERLKNMCNIKIYVDADADERILRRVIRDVKERGRDVEGIARQYLTTVKPMHYMFVEPTKYSADIVINSGLNDVAFDVIRVKIETLLKDRKRNTLRDF